MNAAQKTRLANILTGLATTVALLQGMLVSPPFSSSSVFVLGAVATYVTLIATTWKQYLSPEVSNTGGQITIIVAVVATIAGVLDLIKVFHFDVVTEQKVKWAISAVVAVLNIMSKQLFPSSFQKDKMEDLKYQK